MIRSCCRRHDRRAVLLAAAEKRAVDAKPTIRATDSTIGVDPATDTPEVRDRTWCQHHSASCRPASLNSGIHGRCDPGGVLGWSSNVRESVRWEVERFWCGENPNRCGRDIMLEDEHAPKELWYEQENDEENVDRVEWNSCSRKLDELLINHDYSWNAFWRRPQTDERHATRTV